MITLVGKIFQDSNPVHNAGVQVYVYDEANGIGEWSAEIRTDSEGRYQLSFPNLRDLHQNFSENAEILVASWNDDGDRNAEHDDLGTTIHHYGGEALSVIDVDLEPRGSCEYTLVNNSISLVQNKRTPYIPVFESVNQAAFFHGERVFPQSVVANVLMWDGNNYITPFNLVYGTVGEFTLSVSGINVSNVSFVGTLHITTIEKNESQSLVFDDIILMTVLPSLL